ncbi:MAG TPA: hypothetical protein PK586_07810 [Casimicrobium sp.]|nr:hypothetical protein [Casimicrobium sp.]
MTQKVINEAHEAALPRSPTPRENGDEILAELYAVKAQINRDAHYDVTALLAAARDDRRRAAH